MKNYYVVQQTGRTREGYSVGFRIPLQELVANRNDAAIWQELALHRERLERADRNLGVFIWDKPSLFMVGDVGVLTK